MNGIYRTILVLSSMFVFTSAGMYLYYIYDKLFSKTRLSIFSLKMLRLSLVCFCFYMALLPFYPCYTGFDSVSGFFLSLGGHALRSAFFVLLPVFVILHGQRLMEIRNVPLIRQHVIIIAAIFICMIATNIWMRLLIDDEHAASTITWTFSLSLFLSGVVSALYLTISYTQLTQKQLRYEKELEISRLNELKTKAELEALQAKINPHFLYNTLNSIAELSLSQGQKARTMTIALADLFRYSLNKQQTADTTIAEELEMLENYLSIEKIRFEDRLDVAIQVDAKARAMRIPKFILQPVVENAIKHGLKEPDQKGFINISIMGDGTYVNMMVHDNGLPFPEDMQMGYGLKNVMDKLAAYYPQRHRIVFENTPIKQVNIMIS